jgi:hypothetical protein
VEKGPVQAKTRGHLKRSSDKFTAQIQAFTDLLAGLAYWSLQEIYWRLVLYLDDYHSLLKYLKDHRVLLWKTIT